MLDATEKVINGMIELIDLLQSVKDQMSDDISAYFSKIICDIRSKLLPNTPGILLC